MTQTLDTSSADGLLKLARIRLACMQAYVDRFDASSEGKQQLASLCTKIVNVVDWVDTHPL